MANSGHRRRNNTVAAGPRPAADSSSALLLARAHYHTPVAGYSIPAAEHSTITSWGREREVDAYRNMLRQFARPGSIVAVVSDSYDIYRAIAEHWGTTLREEVIASGATVVIRPDSGDPVDVVEQCLLLLDEAFGHQVNGKGCKVLNHVRVIQGDGINPTSLRAILSASPPPAMPPTMSLSVWAVRCCRRWTATRRSLR